MGSDSPSKSLEIPLSRGTEAKSEHNTINTPPRELPDEEVPLCAINLLEGGGAKSFGGTMVGGAILCTTIEEYCTTKYHTQFKGSKEEK